VSLQDGVQQHLLQSGDGHGQRDMGPLQSAPLQQGHNGDTHTHTHPSCSVEICTLLLCLLHDEVNDLRGEPSVQVEMFGVTADETGEESAQLLQEFIALQKEMFSALELHYRLENTHTDKHSHNLSDPVLSYIYYMIFRICV